MPPAISGVGLRFERPEFTMKAPADTRSGTSRSVIRSFRPICQPPGLSTYVDQLEPGYNSGIIYARPGAMQEPSSAPGSGMVPHEGRRRVHTAFCVCAGCRQQMTDSTPPTSSSGEDGQAPYSARTAWLDRVETPFRSFLRTETGSAVVLLVATVTAVVWVNVDAS